MSAEHRRGLLIASGVVHPTLLARRALRDGLRAAPVDWQRLPHLNALPRADLAQVDVIALYFHHKRVNDAALDALEDYLNAGGGLVAWHSASASFKESDRYRDMLGGYFVEHGPITDFEVEVSATLPESFDGLAPFAVRDELYRHSYHPDCQIILHTTIAGEGGQEPVCWLRRVGQGRVFYCALGHTTASLRHPMVQQLIKRSVDWAVTRLAS